MTSDSTGETVVVTGAGGYVGRHVITALLDRGFAVRAVVRRAGAVLDDRATVVELDVLDDGADVERILGDGPAALVHLAWQDGFRHDAPSHMANLSAHVRFLNAAADRVPRVAVLGTMHEVGYWEGPITAETPTNPRSQYGIAKDALRRSLQLSLPGRTELAWLRCYYIYGDDRNNSSVFTRLLEAVDAGKPTLPFTSGANQYDFIRVEELAAEIAVVATTRGETGVINCSSGTPVSLADQVEGFIRENALPIRLEYGAFPDRPYDSPAVWGDAEDIRRIMAAADATPGGTA